MSGLLKPADMSLNRAVRFGKKTVRALLFSFALLVGMRLARHY
jgi:hypothetical protein